MKRSIAGILGTVALVASLSVAPAAHAADVAITGVGASYVDKAFQACKTSVAGVSLTYSGTGSGDGRKGLTNSTHNFGAMDFPYGTSDAKPSFAWTYVPVVGGPIVLAYNVPGLSLKLDAQLISDIFKGKITKWNDKAIAKLNKGKLPSNDISLIVRGKSSGTTQNFSSFLKSEADSTWNNGPVDFSLASGNSKVTSTGSNSLSIAAVKTTPYSITYADLADTLTGGVQLAAVKNGAGQFVKPSVLAASKFLAAQEMAKNGVVRYNYSDSISGAYNLSLISYIAAPTSKGTAAAEATRTWIQGFLSNCSPSKSPAVGYVPLTGNALKIAKVLAAKVG